MPREATQFGHAPAVLSRHEPESQREEIRVLRAVVGAFAIPIDPAFRIEEGFLKHGARRLFAGGESRRHPRLVPSALAISAMQVSARRWKAFTTVFAGVKT